MASIMVPWHICYNLVKFGRTFVAWVLFVKAVFSCLNLKLDNGLLPDNIPELFKKTGHDLTDIVIA